MESNWRPKVGSSRLLVVSRCEVKLSEITLSLVHLVHQWSYLGLLESKIVWGIFTSPFLTASNLRQVLL